MTSREEKIRQRAHRIWEDEGRPEGRADDHWNRAAREVERQQQANGSATHPAETGGLPEPHQIPDISNAPSLQTADPAPDEPTPRRGKAGSGVAPRKRVTTKR